MATPRKVTLAATDAKHKAVHASASTADGNVIVEYDEDLPPGEVAILLDKCRDSIREQRY